MPANNANEATRGEKDRVPPLDVCWRGETISVTERGASKKDRCRVLQIQSCVSCSFSGGYWWDLVTGVGRRPPVSQRRPIAERPGIMIDRRRRPGRISNSFSGVCNEPTHPEWRTDVLGENRNWDETTSAPAPSRASVSEVDAKPIYRQDPPPPPPPPQSSA